MDKSIEQTLKDFIWNMCRQPEKVDYYGLVDIAFPDMDEEQRYKVVQEMKKALGRGRAA